MGFGGISIWQVLLVLAIVLLFFGSKRLRNLGSDLGNAFKGFRKAIKEETETSEPEKTEPMQSEQAAEEQKDSKPPSG